MTLYTGWIIWLRTTSSIWLQIVSPISELCTVLNASANIVIYKLINSSTIANNFSTIIRGYFGWIPSSVTSTSPPIIVARPTDSHIPSTEAHSPLPVCVARGTDIQSRQHGYSNSSNAAIELDINNQTCRFHVRNQGSE